ncbi:hypothetical protein [Nocardioides speluncae]|uniref:hypothetical protein n=1 Tax=Nocardioides speluncae TaxID=2670337 RepID=UPI0012B18601|nr:hypothetical protein [Nocardioides speluncae]
MRPSRLSRHPHARASCKRSWGRYAAVGGSFAALTSAGLFGAGCASAQAPAATVPTAPVAVAPATWTERDWSADFTATPVRPANGFFAGQGLDVAFDQMGAAWGIGEFAMQATRAKGDAATTHQLPIKAYGNWQWTKPFRSLLNGGQRSESSDLGESVIYAAGAVWIAQGGGQDAGLTQNHSILTRISTTAPYTACQIPIPGDNQHLIGLAHDTKRNRVYFATSEGPDGSNLGWVKAGGLGPRCQNGLDYGGNPALTATQNAALAVAAQQTIDGLRCTSAQDATATGNCVHVEPVSMPTGAAHLAYDAASDSLWSTNWADRVLRQYELASRTLLTHTAPESPYTGPALFGATPWQIAANATHVFMTEYNGHRLLSFEKATGTWSAIETPLDLLGVDGLDVQTHSLTLSGDSLWFTVADEEHGVATAVGRVSVSGWAAGTPHGVLYSGWGEGHSFRGVDVSPTGAVALADAPDGATLLLTPRIPAPAKCSPGIIECGGGA